MTTRETSIRTLAEALHRHEHPAWADCRLGEGMLVNRDGRMVPPEWRGERKCEWDALQMLAASPTLAADLDLGTAWRLAVAALPEGHHLSVALPADGDPCVAMAWDGKADESGHGPDPIAALDALRAALEARPR